MTVTDKDFDLNDESIWKPYTAPTQSEMEWIKSFGKIDNFDPNTEKLSKRLKAMGVKKYKNNFEFTEHPDDIELPLNWKKSKKIFVNSMSDLFHEKSQMEFIANCFHTMLQADWHTFQVLTKRSHIMAEFSNYFQTA